MQKELERSEKAEALRKEREHERNEKAEALKREREQRSQQLLEVSAIFQNSRLLLKLT